MKQVLKVKPTPDQLMISSMAVNPPHKVLVRASHGVGKTWWLGAMTNWFFDSFPENSCVITTAPTSRDVRDLLWAEIRRQRAAAGLPNHFVGASSPEMRTGEDHFAKGFTAAKGESFQGRHYRHMMFCFDEAVGITPIFWETTKSMFQSGGHHIWLAICNPTDTTSQAYTEEQSTDLEGQPAWKTVSLSAFNHPNIKAQLQGLPPPYPAAVTLPQLNSWIADWCEPVKENPDPSLDDFEWPPGSKKFFRPGPLFQSRAMGRWPRQGVTSVWSESSWEAAIRGLDYQPTAADLPCLGVDLAAHGDDWTAIHVRWGRKAWMHESHNGWLEEQTAGRIKQICRIMAAEYNSIIPSGRELLRPEKIPVYFDASGRGGSLINFRKGDHGDFCFIPVHAQGPPRDGDYFNRRTELWFASWRRARNNMMDLTRLGQRERARLRQELLAVRFEVAGTGQCKVEDKDITKKRIKRSPDDADAFNLAWYDSPAWEPPSSITIERRPLQPPKDIHERLAEQNPKSKKLFGRS